VSEFNPSSQGQARFSIGIDLGTTHCALSWVDTQASDGEKVVQGVLQIPQLTGPGAVEGRPLLPSFLYLPHESELAPGDLGLPWSGTQDYAVGEFARSRGAATPIRLVASAKSWLCHPGVDRRGPILPPDAPAEVRASRRWRLRCAICRTCARPGTRRTPMRHSSEQDVTVTIPASFDPVARELTAEAARRGGLRQPDAARGAAGGALQLDPVQRRRLAQAGPARRRDPGGRHRRRHHRLVADRGARARWRARAAPGRGRRPYPARRRQHGPGAGLRVTAQAGAAGHQARRLADARAGPCLPRRQGGAAVGRRAGVGAAGGAEPRLEADRRLDPHRADPRRTRKLLLEGFFPPAQAATSRSAARAPA
jgi:hypothetical protein